MPSPASSSIDYTVLKTILTTTIKGIADEAYVVDDIESVVQSYEPFLIGVAQLSDRLNPAPLKSAAVHIFNATPIEALKFSTQLVEAFKHCKGKLKSYKGTAPKTMHTSVARVVHKMYTKPGHADPQQKISPNKAVVRSSSSEAVVEHKLGETPRHQVQLSNIHIVRYAKVQSNMYTSVSIYVRITTHACNFYFMHTSGACEGTFRQRLRSDDPIAAQSTEKR